MSTDRDTPYHDDHVRDNTLNAGCDRCAPFFEHAGWQRHRERLLVVDEVVIERARIRSAVAALLIYVPRFNGIPPQMFEMQLRDFRAKVLDIIDAK